MSVSKLRITAGLLQPRVHTAAKDSENVVFIPPTQKRSMAGMMRFQQALACLRKGSIVGKPKLTDEGLWEFQMERYAANRWFTIKVAAEVNGAHVVKLYAIFEED